VFLLLLAVGVSVGGAAAYGAPKTKNRKARTKKKRTPRVRKARPAKPPVKITTHTPESLKLAIEDMVKTFSSRYPKGKEYLSRLAALEGKLISGDPAARTAFKTLCREALLANPLLDFDKLLVLRRNFGQKAKSVMSAAMGMPKLNAFANDRITNPGGGWDNEITVLTDLRGEGKFKVIYKPQTKKIITDVDLHFDGRKMLFSSIGKFDRWCVYEIGVNGQGMRQLTPTMPDVSHFDSCYMPDGTIAFTSTATFQGLPCIYGGSPMAVLYRMDADGKNIRQLTFEQDSDWCPTMLNNGKLMYLRWEYSDTPHYFTRILFQCNPDGTGQIEYYGSNSFFPNAFFFARPIPGHPTRVVGVAGGHHGISRSGRLLILDPARGRREADGVVQEIPGRGKTVKPIIRDKLVNDVWPQFLHPFPLDDPSTHLGAGKYFVVSAKLNSQSLWGIYLVDVFDNMTLVKELDGSGLLEPIPLVKTARPPVIPDKVRPGAKTATVFISDIHFGPGLKNIPRGKVKALRLFAYHFNYNKNGGHSSVGVESSWDIKRILGTVPVEKDGSASFTIPASTPISIQPLDEDGAALQLMRSWMVGMPGEVVSCFGCHESQNALSPTGVSIAARRAPSKVTPWYGPARPFSFKYEVQPVLDKYCAACHNAEPRADGKKLPDFTDRKLATFKGTGEGFSEAYMALQPFVRRPGPESDYHLLNPMEYHANTSELVQMLAKGHHNVKLDKEAWERIYAWIDLNAPYRGKWAPPEFREVNQVKRRLELAMLYAGVDTDPESEYDKITARTAGRPRIKPIIPPKTPAVRTPVPKVASWPFDAAQAARRQGDPSDSRKTVDPGGGLKIQLVRIPAGQFVMGSPKGPADESPAAVKISKPFWMAVCEVTNAQYALFDPKHDSRFIDQQWKDHCTPGYPANQPNQPVIRISWNEAVAFCKWLSDKTGKKFTLPTEAQWEWACRAGSNRAFSFGASGGDFSKHANLADKSTIALAVKGVNPKPVKNPNRFLDILPKDSRFDDGRKIVADVGQYAPNTWGLKDMHGNVAEWTLSDYKACPYSDTDGRNDMSQTGRKAVRGGSWRDRPARATCSYRLAYEPYQKVCNVGIRLVMLD